MKASMAAFLLCCLAGVIGASCEKSTSPRAPVAPGAVVGTVSAIEDGSPVADAGVLLIEPSTIRPVAPLARTDGEGRYRIAAVSPGDYALFLFHDQRVIYDRSASLVHVVAGDTVEHSMRLAKSEIWNGHGYRIAGTVVDSSSGDPVADAFVEGGFQAAQDVGARFWGITTSGWAVTDSAGLFSITVMVYTDESGAAYALEPITVTRAGFEPFTLAGGPPGDGLLDIAPLPMPPEGDSTLFVQCRLRRSGTHGLGAVRGQVRFLDTPVSGVRVAASIYVSDNPDILTGPLGVTVPIQGPTAVTDHEGRFTITGLAPGKYGLHPAYLQGDGYVESMERFDGMFHVAASETTDVGIVPVEKAIDPIAPVDRGTVSAAAPVFRWQAAPDTTQYVFLGYWVYIGKGFLLDWGAEGIHRTSWQAPDTLLAAGDHVRWYVEARGQRTPGGNTIVIAAFDGAATATVAP